jgi:opacity protein-like surface antigen
MRSLYEQKWNDAVKGAKIEPSETLWNNIASKLDNQKGRNYWVTLLMIAATITIAFSFPLTIGDSANSSRPDTNLHIAQSMNVEADNSVYDQSVIKNTNSPPLAINAPIKGVTGDEEKNTTFNVDDKNYSSTITNEIIKSNSNLANYQYLSQKIVVPQFDWDTHFELADINNHYLIPYFMPILKEDNNNLLASINMGTGNSSSGNGILTNKTAESAKAFGLSNDSNGFSDSATKNESKGTTLYLSAGIELPVGNRFSLLAGIGYLAQKMEGNNNVVLDNGDTYQPLGIYDPIMYNSVFLSSSYSYLATNNYISLPISIKYPIINRKLKFRVGAGVSTDFMLSHVINSDAYGKASYKPSEVAYEPVVLSGLVNLDLSYYLSNQYSVALETGIRKGITPIDKNKELYPSSFTIGIVLFYKIR